MSQSTIDSLCLWGGGVMGCYHVLPYLVEEYHTTEVKVDGAKLMLSTFQGCTP